MNKAELQFSRDLRSELRARGLGVLVIVEADEPGPSDLMVFEKEMVSVLLGWLELKVDDEALRPSQVEFLRARDKETGNAFVVRLESATGVVTIERPAKPSGWSTDRSRLEVLYHTKLNGNLRWEKVLGQLRRSRGLSSR